MKNVTITINKQIAVFQFPSPQDEEELIQISPNILALDKMKNGEILARKNQIWSTGKVHGQNQSNRPPPDSDNIWFPTKETGPNVEILPSLQRKIYDNVTELQKRYLKSSKEIRRSSNMFKTFRLVTVCPDSRTDSRNARFIS